MYTLLIEAEESAAPLREWLRAHAKVGDDLVVLDRDVVAAQLLRSDAPPTLVVRSGVRGLDTSPILSVALDSGRDLPPVLVLCAATDESIVAGLSEPALHPVRFPADAAGLHRVLDRLTTPDDGSIALRFGGKGPELHHGCLVGESPPMQRIYKMLGKVARTDSTCLITGDSGTGKELAARIVHDLSDRAEAGFIPVNCGAIPENLLESEFFGHKRGAFTGAVSDHKGRFEMADKGTLFLDEIGEMQLPLQVKLLRALQTGDIQPVGANRTKQVDVRVVAATNRDLEAEMARGNFREDLYYRLAIIPVTMPPLRGRPEDIPLLVEHLVGLINARSDFPVSGISRGTLDALCAYEWPGNIRELRAALERMVVMAESETLTVDDLPHKVRAALGLVDEDATGEVDAFATPALPEEGLQLASAVDRYETALILQALERTGWNRNQAAMLLKMNRTTLVEKIKRKKLTEPGRDDAACDPS
jgi:DNA-binding NtrC family response regulator